MATSTVIRSAWYLPSRQELDLLFVSGRRYIYSGVPMVVAEGFAAAESKGRYYNAEIRNRFACRRAGRGGVGTAAAPPDQAFSTANETRRAMNGGIRIRSARKAELASRRTRNGLRDN